MKLLILACLALTAFASVQKDYQKARLELIKKQYQLGTNRIPKSDFLKQLKQLQAAQNEQDSCASCKAAVQDFVTVLKDPTKDAKVTAYLHDLCPYTFLVMSEEDCHSVVNEDLAFWKPLLADILEDTEQACETVHLCNHDSDDEANNAVKRVVASVFQHQVNSLKQLSSSTTDVCFDCELVVNEAKKFLNSSKTQDEAKTELLKICGIFKSHEDKCGAFIQHYWPEIISKLEKYAGNAKDVCTDFKMCTGGQLSWLGRALKDTNSVGGFLRYTYNDVLNKLEEGPLKNAGKLLPHKKTRAGSTAGCIACESVFAGVLAFIENSNETIWGCTHTVQKFCSKHMPESFDEQCQDFMNLYGPTFFKLSFEQMSAEGICTTIEACTKTDIDNQLADAKKPFHNLRCDSCHTMMNLMKATLKNKKVEDEIVKLIDGLCSVIGDKTTKEECKSGASANVPAYIYQLASIINDDTACQAIHMC